MRRKIKTAVIGVGSMGERHARVYHELTSLVAVADTNSAVGKVVAKKYNTHYYKDFREMLVKERPEAISIAVPTLLHKDVAMACLKLKIPILVEKPIASSFSEAKIIIREAQRQQVPTMVGHIERFNPGVVKLKYLVGENRFGKIINLLAIRVGVNPPKVHRSDVALDLAVHDVDIFNYLLEEFPVKVVAEKNKIYTHNIADTASFLIFYNHARAMVQTNWITPIKMRKLYLTGTKGFAELDYITQKLVVYDEFVQTKLDGNFLEFISLYQSPKKEIYISRKEPLKEELAYFIQCVRTHTITDLSYALEAVRIALE